jgi:sulfopropanediol 3-dehydrogenase
MVEYLKRGISRDESHATDAKVREVVVGILEDIEERGDAAVRELSERFDDWSPESFRLSEEEIQDLVDSLPRQTVEDIEFAQAQIRNFAERQREALQDIEVETLPGVTLGHKNIPVNSVGC